MEPSVRPAIAAGTFYPGTREALASAVADLLGEVDRRCAPLDSPLGLIAPHAGYPYSGPTAAAGYREVVRNGRPDVVVILGANHTGFGEPLSLDDHRAWWTPLGETPVDRDLVSRLEQSGIRAAPDAFVREHSIEVHLPFVQVLWGVETPILPICVQPLPHDTLSDAAEALVDALTDRSSVLLVASSDFTHYEPDEAARRLDRSAIEPILALDSTRFLDLCRAERLSICGAGAIALLIEVAARLGITDTQLIDYSTSGDTSADRSAVVGYAAISFSRRNHGS